MQKIDTDIEKELSIKKYRYKVDYDIFRYVDDYFLFYSNDEVKEEILSLYELKLKEFNLFFNESKTEKIELTDQLLFPTDNDQLAVFKEGKNKNLVVQGPPGTGKSQVLSNFIGKTLHDQLPTLVVSEKRVALEVLQKKLSQFQLDKFCFLPKSWEFYIQNNSYDWIAFYTYNK